MHRKVRSGSRIVTENSVCGSASYLESHTFRITQISTENTQDLKSIDTGLGMSYQFFIGRYFYIQPGVHLYLRSDKSANFNGAVYNIPNADVSPVIRLGAIWRKAS